MATGTRMQAGFEYVLQDTLVTKNCGSCGVLFAMPSSLEDDCLKDHRKDWYCPNGHARHYIGETEADKQARLRKWAEDRATRLQADLDRTEASRRAWKGQTTRLRNRAAEGQCAYCGKFLVDLAVHVSRMHPDEHPRELTEADA